MCEVPSALVTDDGRVLLCGDGQRHTGGAKDWGLKPGTYRECEWPEHRDLVVRYEPGETDEEKLEWREKVLRRYSTRKAFVNGLTEGRAGGLVYRLHKGDVVAVSAPLATELRLYNLPLVTEVSAPLATELRLYNLPLVTRKAQGRHLTWAQFVAIVEASRTEAK